MSGSGCVGWSWRVFLSAVALLGWFGSGQCGASARPDPPPSENITAQMKADDARLAKPVDLHVLHATMEEVLASLKSQTGVQVGCGTKDGTAEVPIAAFCKQMPLGDVLNSLWSLVSYKKGEWAWKRSWSVGRYAYRLAMTPEAQATRERLRSFAWNEYVREVKALLRASGGSAAERQAALNELYDGSPPKYMSPSVDDLFAYMRVLRDGASPGQMEALLRGGRADLVTAQLPPAVQETVHSIWQSRRDLGGRVLPDGTHEPLPEPTCLWYQPYTWELGLPGLEVRHVMLDDSGRFVGSPVGHRLVAASVPYRKYWAAFAAAWLMDADTDDDPLAGQTIAKEVSGAAPLTEEDGSQRQPLRSLQRVFEHIALGTGLPLFARLPQECPLERNWRVPGSTVRYVCAHGLAATPVMSKWRDGVLLCTTIVWPLEDPPIPNEFLAKLRAHYAPGQFLPMEDLALMAASLTPKQLLTLQRQYPMVNAIIGAQAMLTLLHKSPGLWRQAMTDSGLALTPPVIAALRQLPPSPISQALDAGTARYLTIRVKLPEEGKPRVRRVEFRVLDADGKFITGLGFADAPLPYPPGQEPPADGKGAAGR